jgi:peptidoglycan/xylan/chitin deacetylase (PgdA/CDA1 family)/folate-dependent phosphoribosylglycinamide formyltransferase PurN
LKIVVLTGINDFSTVQVLEAISADPATELTGIVYQPPDTRFKLQWRNFKRNLKKEGWGYVFQRINRLVLETLERLLSRVAPPAEVAKLLAESFPDRAFKLEDFASRRGIELCYVGDINSVESISVIQSFDAELGVVIGTKILKERIFSVPKLGSINIHKGKIPKYRGTPPAFWEIYNGETSAGVTVHFIDKDLDTGDVIGETVVPIGNNDTVGGVQRKLDRAAIPLLVSCIRQVREGSAVRVPQVKDGTSRPNTLPTRTQRLKLGSKLGSAHVRDRFAYTAKTAFYAFLYFSGVLSLKRWLRTIFRSQRCAIVLQHRVNDDTEDAITTGVTKFAEHITVFKKYFEPISTNVLVSKLRNSQRLPSNGVLLHFDDCYRDVYTNASRILAAASVPACAFISSGFIDSDRSFDHDDKRYSGPFLNLRSTDIQGLLERGMEIGSHTVNHADLGQSSLDEARFEIFESKKQLETLTGNPVIFFSFPFGRTRNSTDLVKKLVMEAGYDALFSADGGFVTRGADVYALQRLGVHGAYRPIDLLVELEGLSLGNIRRSLNRHLRGR